MDSSSNKLTVEFYDTTHHLLKHYYINQTISDVLPSSITMVTDNEFYQKPNTNDNTILTRVHKAQCKLYGIGTKKNEDQGFRELYQLRQYPESYYPLACYYDDTTHNQKAFEYFDKCNTSLAKYRMSIIYFKQYKAEQGLEYMTVSANEGNKYAQLILAIYYHRGILVKQSIETAKLWYQRSANQGLAEAQTALANLLLQQIHSTKTEVISEQTLLDHALEWLSKAKSQENASALIRLGSLHEEGILVEQDNSKAIEYYKRATLSPFAYPSILALAHYLVGINYHLGELGLTPDTTKALDHLTKSSHLGYAPAQRTLGIMYAEGIGIEKNVEQSRILFQLAASQGDIRSLGFIAHTEKTLDAYERAARAGSLSSQIALAQLYQSKHQHALALKWFEIASHSTHVDQISILKMSLGYLYQRSTARLMVARYRYNGWGGVKRDMVWAVKELMDLSSADFSESHYWLAAWYEEVKCDLEEAYSLYMKGAISNDIDCQFQVAYMLSNGFATSDGNLIKDTEAAFGWYIKAAERGHKTAQYSVGLYYENGLYINVDIKKAIYWYKLASSNNMTLAMVRLARLLDNPTECVEWLTRAIDQDDVSALRELATFYKNGLIEGGDQQKAMYLFQQAAGKNDAMSWHALSEFYEHGIIEPVNLEKAVSCLMKAESLGYSVAGLNLAELYYRNEMVKEALQVYRRLSESSSVPNICWKAKIELSKLIVFEGCGTELEQAQIYALLIQMQSESQDLAQVYEILGYCSEHGIGTVANKQVSLDWYISCTDQKETDWARQRSLCRLVNFYIDDQDYFSAFKYLQDLKPDLDDMSQLSEDASIQARRMRYYLGYMLIYGLGTEVLIPEGISWLTFAADEGDNDAAYELGGYYTSINEEEEAKHRYEEGTGHAGCMRALALLLLLEENDMSNESDEYDGSVTILELFEQAAELGDTVSLYQLGLIHENGLGTVVFKDIEKALSFYTQAAAASYELAMIKSGEILGNIMDHHVKAMYWFQKAVDLTNNIKAKVMLISYDFQGYGTINRNDTDHFNALQELIEREAIEPTGTYLKQQEYDEKVSENKVGLGLAFYILGQCYEIGRGTSSDISLAKEWYRRSVLISQNVDAMWRLGVIYCTLETDHTSALEWFRKAAEKGRHRESHYQLGLFHLNGLGKLEQNMVAAQKYFSKASEQGHALATYELARIVWNYKQDHIFGYELFKLAGKLQVADALRELGHLSHTGFSFQGIMIVAQDYKRAFAYYCESAQLGDAIAALMVGNYFEEGYLKEELGKDSERALQWYESAYQLNGGGLAELAIGKLKHMMADTIADPKEAEDMREEAFVWFESAAGDVSNTISGVCARIMVALYYLNSWGRKPQDAKTGFHMLLDIAESGGSEAYVTVAKCYEKGVGTEHDMTKALTYWEMAADNNEHDALVRVGEIYELGLTGQQPDKSIADTYYNRAMTETFDSECYSSSSSSASLFSEKTLP
ncbi:hypothetical protein EDC94DRAFT_627566 [Helicostylum pulchrum]|nr:hypothetical protein EDC94DRAFT_627566 [Helicostylum pulchrum]